MCLILLPVTTENQFSMRKQHAQGRFTGGPPYSEDNLRTLRQHDVLHLLSALPGPDASIDSAALDVFWNTPSIDPGFAELDNVVLQAHSSSAAVKTRTPVADLVRDNLQAPFNCKPLLTEYTR
jgi:phosphoglycerate dehydrogenase-like enzyme